MMIYARLAFGIAALLVIGWSVLFFIGGAKRRCRPEEYALSFALGVGLVSAQMLLTYFIRQPLQPGFIIAPWCIVIMAAAAISMHAAGQGAGPVSCCKDGPRRRSPLETALICGIAFEVAYAFFLALIKPIESYDAIAIYAIKSKMLYVMGVVSPDFFTALAAMNPHPDYPLNIPLIETFLYIIMGGLNDQLIKVMFPLFYCATIMLLYCSVRTFGSRSYALLFAFLLGSIPQFTAYAGNAYHEVPLACYIFASFLFLMRFIEDPSRAQDAILAAIFVGLAGWTKNDGLLYCVVHLTVLGVFCLLNAKRLPRGARIAAAASPVIILALLLPWIIIKRQFGLVNNEIELSRVNPAYLLQQLGKLGPIAYEFQKQFFGPKKWLIVWPVAAGVLAIYWRKAFSGIGRYIALWLGLAIAGYILFYMISRLDIHYFLSKTWSRFLLHFLPVVMYYVAWTLKDEVDL